MKHEETIKEGLDTLILPECAVLPLHRVFKRLAREVCVRLYYESFPASKLTTFPTTQTTTTALSTPPKPSLLTKCMFRSVTVDEEKYEEAVKPNSDPQIPKDLLSTCIVIPPDRVPEVWYNESKIELENILASLSCHKHLQRTVIEGH